MLFLSSKSLARVVIEQKLCGKLLGVKKAKFKTKIKEMTFTKFKYKMDYICLHKKRKTRIF